MATRISPLRALAIQAASEPSLDFYEAYGQRKYIEVQAKGYIERVRGRKVLVDNPTEEKLLSLPYITRFDNEYYQEKVKEIRALRSLNLQGGVFLTLTLDPSRFSSLKDAYTHLMKGWNKLASMYTLRFKRKGMKVSWIRVIEFQDGRHKDSGQIATYQPHIHVCFLGLKWLEDWRDLLNRWDKKYNVGMHIRITKIYDHINSVNYVLKYLRKGWVAKGQEDWTNLGREECRKFDNLALSWALQARIFALGGVCLLRRMTNSNVRDQVRRSLELTAFIFSVMDWQKITEEMVDTALERRKGLWIVLGSIQSDGIGLGILTGEDRTNALATYEALTRRDS